MKDNPNCTGVAAQLHSTELEMEKVEEVGRKIVWKNWKNALTGTWRGQMPNPAARKNPLIQSGFYWYTDIVEGKSFVEKERGRGHDRSN